VNIKGYTPIQVPNQHEIIKDVLDECLNSGVMIWLIPANSLFSFTFKTRAHKGQWLIISASAFLEADDENTSEQTTKNLSRSLLERLGI